MQTHPYLGKQPYFLIILRKCVLCVCMRSCLYVHIEEGQGVSVHGHTHALKTEVNIECLTCSFYLSSASTNSAWSITVQLDHIILMTRLYFSRKPSSSYVINLDAISPSLMSLLFHLPTHYNTSLSKHVINLQK